MNHKEKCKVMKKMRKDIADQIGLDLHQTECTYKGECRGTCPRCAAEEKKLNKALLSGSFALAGLAVSSITLTGCGSNSGDYDLFEKTPITTTTEDWVEGMPIDIDGDIGYQTPTTGETTEVPIDGDITEPTEDLAGEIAMYLDDEVIIEVSINYTKADVAKIVNEDNGLVTVECYIYFNDNTEKIIDVLTFDRYNSYATDGEGKSFSIYDYTSNF